MSRLFRTTNNGVLIMSDVTLGQIPGPYHKRDAIHIAVIPIEAGEVLKPGQRVVLNQDKKAIATQSRWDSTGIVDPFLDREVRKGEMFWLVLRQNTVTGMRHHWYHAEFRDHKDTPSMTPDIEAHVAFVESCADEAGLDFDELMEAADRFLKDGSYLSEGGRWEGHYLPEEFWTHYGAIRGVVVPENERESFFSCSC